MFPKHIFSCRIYVKTGIVNSLTETFQPSTTPIQLFQLEIIMRFDNQLSLHLSTLHSLEWYLGQLLL